MDYLDVSARFTREMFPSAEIAVIGGSTARGTRTPTSDIDLLLVGDKLFHEDRTSLAASYAFENEVFEVFAYTRASFDEWAQSGVEQHRPVIVHMLLDGVTFRGSTAAAELSERWRGVIENGPVVSRHELDMRRYKVTDLCDDLRDAADRVERYFLAFSLFEHVAELILLTNQRWIGSGKYLPRRLRDLDLERAEALTQPLLLGDFQAFLVEAERELDVAGGRVQAGFVR